MKEHPKGHYLGQIMTKLSKAADRLQLALETFQGSNRFGFLRALQVGRLLGDEGSFGAVADLTCERLVELGADGVRAGYRLSSSQIEKLAELVMALGNGPNDAASSGMAQGVMQRPTEGVTPELAVNSVQVELDLRAKLEEARAHPRFSELRPVRLGSHWDSAWPRAPFEEALTIGQLADMDIALLFKKRTTSGSRVHYLTKALARALGVPAAGEPARAFAAALAAPTAPHPAPANRIEHPWLAAGDDATSGQDPATLALLEIFVASVPPASAQLGVLGATMATLPNYLSRAEFLQVLSTEDLPARAATQLGKWLRDSAGSPCIGLIQEALQTPGCPVSVLARIVSDDGRYSAFSGVAAIVLARALKAQRVRYGERVCPGMWSLNPSLVPLVIDEAKRRKGRDILKTVRELCPALDPILQSWISEVTGPVSPRKGKRRGK